MINAYLPGLKVIIQIITLLHIIIYFSFATCNFVSILSMYRQFLNNHSSSDLKIFETRHC